MAQDTKPVIAGEFAIEIDTGRNDAYLWPPTQDRLRGGFSPYNYPPGSESSAGLFQFPPFPGVIIRVNPREKRAMITDPLQREDNKELLEKISVQFKHTFQMGNLSGGVTFCPDKVHENLTVDQVATWVYWMMRAVTAKFARPAQGSAPIPTDERGVHKLFPGAEIRKDHFNSLSSHLRREQEDEEAEAAAAPAVGVPAK